MDRHFRSMKRRPRLLSFLVLEQLGKSGFKLKRVISALRNLAAYLSQPFGFRSLNTTLYISSTLTMGKEEKEKKDKEPQRISRVTLNFVGFPTKGQECPSRRVVAEIPQNTKYTLVDLVLFAKRDQLEGDKGIQADQCVFYASDFAALAAYSSVGVLRDGESLVVACNPGGGGGKGSDSEEDKHKKKDKNKGKGGHGKEDKKDKKKDKKKHESESAEDSDESVTVVIEKHKHSRHGSKHKGSDDDKGKAKKRDKKKHGGSDSEDEKHSKKKDKKKSHGSDSEEEDVGGKHKSKKKGSDSDEDHHHHHSKKEKKHASDSEDDKRSRHSRSGGSAKKDDKKGHSRSGSKHRDDSDAEKHKRHNSYKKVDESDESMDQGRRDRSLSKSKYYEDDKSFTKTRDWELSYASSPKPRKSLTGTERLGLGSLGHSRTSSYSRTRDYDF